MPSEHRRNKNSRATGRVDWQRKTQRFPTRDPNCSRANSASLWLWREISPEFRSKSSTAGITPLCQQLLTPRATQLEGQPARLRAESAGGASTGAILKDAPTDRATPLLDATSATPPLPLQGRTESTNGLAQRSMP